MASRKGTRVIINTYNKKAKEHIKAILRDFLDDDGAAECAEPLLTCVDELVKNAIKANYKYLVIRREIARRVFNRKLADGVRLRMGKEHFERAAVEIAKDGNVSAKVREILDQESVYIALSNRAYDEKREFDGEEQKKISSLDRFQSIRKEIRGGEIKTILAIERRNGRLSITVTNTAPILTRDLQRIEEKRREYIQYLAEGREHEFFINNIDTSESGFGLGYAVITSCLCGLGIQADEALVIEPSDETTVRLLVSTEKMRHSTDREVELVPV
ncbi:MAG TPA: hypothetical protein ENN21_11470 [Spirochaetes bacterium]|nr:hypothetical protein [Spirochaetota bacterium]